MRRGGFGGGRDFGAGRDHDGLRHAVVKGNDDIVAAAIGAGVVKGPDDGGVAALENTHDAALLAAIGFGRVDLDEDLVALHGGVDLVGRDEDVLSAARLAPRGGLRLGRTKP